ncbi:MAG: biotin synthase BioB [Candidatus Omnitrophica bacterium]|nr:biotin synthase BioB [Candidatus Omnitrophota bacterium]
MVYNMNRDEILKLIGEPIESLLASASSVREQYVGSGMELCGIMNAKSGSCPEDCKFCAQSAHYSTNVAGYDLRTRDDMFNAALEAKKNGAKRFGIVTSGNKLTVGELDEIIEGVNLIKSGVDIDICASLGALAPINIKRIKDAGVTRYHHNIETSRRHYPQIVTTHSYDERLDTVRSAKISGMEVCSGGILGIGESWEDRVDLALQLKELDVDSVPINVLVPIKGTPLEGSNLITPFDVIRSIAMFRIVLRSKTIKIAAGRESALKDYQALIFMAGANGMMIGGYLTVAGRAVSEDWELVRNIEGLWKKG